MFRRSAGTDSARWRARRRCRSTRWVGSGGATSVPRSRTARMASRCAAPRGAGERPTREADASFVATFAPLAGRRALSALGLGGFLTRYPIGLARPRAEIDRLAALGAERAKARRRRPFDRLAAMRTGDDLRWHQRLQNASSKSTSRAY